MRGAMMTTAMGGKNLFKSLALEDGESAARRQELRRRKTAASMKRSAGEEKVYANERGKRSSKVKQVRRRRRGGAGVGGGKPSKTGETLHQHPAGAETHRRRAARGTRASRSRWASAGSCGSWCLWSCSWRPSSPEPRRRSRCLTVDGNIGKRAGVRGGEGRGKSITEKLEVKEEQRLVGVFLL